MLKVNKDHSRHLLLRQVPPAPTRHGRRQAVNVSPGFSLVEMLIVIVVIAILAAITMVTYSGITQRAENSRRIAAARQIQELFKSYTSSYGKNPATVDGSYASGGMCLTVDKQCTNYAAQDMQSVDNSVLMTELRKIGSPPQSAPGTAGNAWGTYKGLYLDYNNYRTYNGKAAPYLMMFWLKGDKQQCALPDTVMSDPAHPDIPGVQNAFLTSTKGYSYSSDDYPTEDAGLTECYISL